VASGRLQTTTALPLFAAAECECRRVGRALQRSRGPAWRSMSALRCGNHIRQLCSASPRRPPPTPPGLPNPLPRSCRPPPSGRSRSPFRSPLRSQHRSSRLRQSPPAVRSRLQFRTLNRTRSPSPSLLFRRRRESRRTRSSRRFDRRRTPVRSSPFRRSRQGGIHSRRRPGRG
jgi:hypothetical protein